MRAIQWMIPGRRRLAHLEQSLRGIAESARRETELHRFTPRLARLWTAFCDQAENTVYQLIIRNDDGRLDWGLRKHRSKVDYAQLVAIYWWMLLYQLVLFRNRGLYGYFPSEELPIFSDAAHSFLQREFRNLPGSVPLPEPWDEQWLRKHTLESALEIYNLVYDRLGLDNDLSRRIGRVSHFTTATETAYDRLAGSRAPTGELVAGAGQAERPTGRVN